MEQGFRAIAQRLADGEREFAERLTRFAMISRGDALKAMRVMVKLKVARRDLVSGQIAVINGAYLDHDVICRAVEIANK